MAGESGLPASPGLPVRTTDRSSRRLPEVTHLDRLLPRPAGPAAPPAAIANLLAGGLGISASLAAALALDLLGWPLLGLAASGGVALLVPLVATLLLRGFSFGAFAALLVLAMAAGLGVFLLADTNPLGWPDPRVPVAGLAVREELSGSATITLRKREGIRVEAAPVLPPGTGQEGAVTLWAVRNLSVPPTGEAPWRSGVPIALEAAGDLAAMGRQAIRDAEARHGLAAAPESRLLRWTSDADASLAEAQRAMLRLAAALNGLWASWVAGEVLVARLRRGAT